MNETAYRNKQDQKVTHAHRRVLNIWPDLLVEQLDNKVIHEPLTKPDYTGKIENEFYAARRRVLKNMEMECVGYRHVAPGIDIPWKWKPVGL